MNQSKAWKCTENVRVHSYERRVHWTVSEKRRHTKAAKKLDVGHRAQSPGVGVLKAALNLHRPRTRVQRCVDHAPPCQFDRGAPGGIGLLREITGYARNRRFRFEPYLRLFEETGAGVV